MKALKIFLTLSCMGVIVSCSKDESAPAPTKEQPTPQQPNFPTIKNFSAQEVTVGDVITIEGENFNPSQTYTITFNGVKGTIKEVTSNHLKVEIPEEATSGEVILSSNEISKSIGRLTILPKPSVLYAYVAYNKIVKLDLQTGKELETIAEIGREYLGRGIYYLKSTNEIIGIQSRNSEYDLFKLNLTTKEVIKLSCSHYEKLIIANNEPYAYDLNNRKIVKLDLQTGKEIETIAEVGRNYLSHIQFLPKTNEIIGLQSEYNSETSENECTFFRLNLITKEIIIKPCNRYEDFIVANDDLYAYVSYNKIVKLNVQTGEELETIAEIGRDYLAHIQFSKSTNEIIGLQSGTEKNLFKLNLKTKQVSKTPIKNYENLIIANY
ncbi:IPT/TIG domain-containing protein [Capnocytophaga gingivalis]|uniref:IPT/TIG domain-containing protein n=1 Tax=Capnocytophaga gingivalis TaxID=1017 RepID=UPI002B47507D|nr:IPT/TIG domain-containing protein [Capnocytophaga gingivalis]MEB3013257.1 IPT/TIG domain-containing protein [Capnocytophaga gingivalis]